MKWPGRAGERRNVILLSSLRGRDIVDEGARKAGTKDHKAFYAKLRDLCLP